MQGKTFRCPPAGFGRAVKQPRRFPAVMFRSNINDEIIPYQLRFGRSSDIE